MENTEATSVSLLREIIDVNNNKATNLIETQYVASDDPFGQGDIIQLLERPRAPHFGVVINADCDLLHRKTDGVCSYLPIYSFHEYLFEFWIDRFLDTQKQQIVAQIANTIKQPNSENHALKQWLESDDFASLPDRLTAEFELNTKTKSILSKQVTRYVSIFCSNQDSMEQFATLCRAQKDPTSYASRQFNSACEQMGDDHLFINEIHGQIELGYVVRARRIYSIQTDSYFRSERELRKSSHSISGCALRVAKLTTIMRFRLIQLFVHHFTRVGLPDDIRDMRQLIVDDVATTLLGEPR